MPYGNITRHPSYNNRYRTSSSEVGSPVDKTDQLRSVSEMVSHGEKSPTSPTPLNGASPAPLTGARAKRAKYMESRSVSQSAKTITQSTDSCTDEVFLEMGDHDIITNPSDIIKMVEKRQLEATLSNSSTATILPNPYNKINHKIHSFFWCTCCLYFVFICCLPGVHYMQESDEAYRKGDEKRAQRLGKMATLMFIAGTIFSVACYAAILFVVIFFTAYR